MSKYLQFIENKFQQSIISEGIKISLENQYQNSSEKEQKKMNLYPKTFYEIEITKILGENVSSEKELSEEDRKKNHLKMKKSLKNFQTTIFLLNILITVFVIVVTLVSKEFLSILEVSVIIIFSIIQVYLLSRISKIVDYIFELENKIK